MGLGGGEESKKKTQRRESLLEWSLREPSQLEVGIGLGGGVAQFSLWPREGLKTLLAEWGDGWARAQPSSWRFRKLVGQNADGGGGGQDPDYRCELRPSQYVIGLKINPDCVSGQLWRDWVEKFFPFAWCVMGKNCQPLYTVLHLKYSGSHEEYSAKGRDS